MSGADAEIKTFDKYKCASVLVLKATKVESLVIKHE